MWEKPAIDCVTNKCEQIYTEVFRTDSIEEVKLKCDQFFELMPDPNQTKDQNQAGNANC